MEVWDAAVGKGPPSTICNLQFHSRRAAFPLIEATVAIALTAIAASVLLMGTTTSLGTGQDAQDETIAMGMAQQLMD